MWIDKEVMIRNGEVAASERSERYSVVSAREVRVDNMTHVKMSPHEFWSKTRIDVIHLNFHPHCLQ